MEQEYQVKMQEYMDLHFANNADTIMTQINFNIDYIFEESMAGGAADDFNPVVSEENRGNEGESKYDLFGNDC